VFVLDGLPVNVIDTAGLRSTDDRIEAEGLRRAREELGRADHVLWLADCRDDVTAAIELARANLGEAVGFTLIRNKVDLLEAGEQRNERERGPQHVSPGAHAGVESSEGVEGVELVSLSALTGQGIDTLIAHLKSLAGWRDEVEGSFGARRRHLVAIGNVAGNIEAAKAQLRDSPELAAEELRAAQVSLSELTGEFSSDDLLGEIFSSFCIGK